MQAIRRVFFASLFFVLTVLLAIWFYPGISEKFSNFNSNVQGGIGSDSTAYYWALNALDVGAALLCASALFYGAILAFRRRKAIGQVENSAPAIAKALGKNSRQSAQFRRRLLLIPVWLVAQYVWNLFSGMSASQALAMMTSIESLWISVVVITVIVLYARNYQVVFGKESEQKRKPATPEK